MRRLGIWGTPRYPPPCCLQPFPAGRLSIASGTPLAFGPPPADGAWTSARLPGRMEAAGVSRGAGTPSFGASPVAPPAPCAVRRVLSRTALFFKDTCRGGGGRTQADGGSSGPCLSGRTVQPVWPLPGRSRGPRPCLRSAPRASR